TGRTRCASPACTGSRGCPATRAARPQPCRSRPTSLGALLLHGGSILLDDGRGRLVPGRLVLGRQLLLGRCILLVRLLRNRCLDGEREPLRELVEQVADLREQTLVARLRL